MARIKKIVISNTPHHVIQRGVRSMNIFFKHDDYEYNKKLLFEQSKSIDYKNFLLEDKKIEIINEKTRIGKPCVDESFYDCQISNCHQSVVTDKLKNIV